MKCASAAADMTGSAATKPSGRNGAESRSQSDSRPERNASTSTTQRHPTPSAPLAEWIGRSRFVVLIAVVSVLLISMSLFVLGAAMAVQGIWVAAQAILAGEMASSSITVSLLEVVSVLLKGVVFYLIGVGFYSLFIAPLNVAAALGITTFNDLEIKVVSVIIVIMGITFLEHFIRWDQAVETFLFAISLGVVVAALVFFQKQSHREAIEGEHEQASLRVRAQQNLFHEDQEEREVQPEEATERTSGEAGR